MIIRDETPADIQPIEEVTIEAFRVHPISRHTEQFIIQGLRRAGALSLSLVAEVDGRVAGHIAFSPVTLSDGTPDWYGMGPVSVLPLLQRQGIGQSLVREGLARLLGLGAGGCALVGDPAYYTRFGFANHPQLIHEGIPQEVFLILPFGPAVPSGTIQFHEAFQATS